MHFYLIALFLLSGIPTASAAEIIIHSQKVKKVSMDPNDALWQSAPAALIPLTAQHFVSPIGGGAVSSVEVKSLHTEKEIYFWLSWGDKTKSTKLASSGKFSDACALQFPMNPQAIPSSFMGEKGNPVNIWHWKAVVGESERYAKAYSDFYRFDAIETQISFPLRQVQELIAEGFGTLTPSSAQTVESKSIYQDGKWTVVFQRARDLKSGTIFNKDAVLPIAFAVWDGDHQERDGAKSVSLWQWLVLGDGKIPAAENEIARGKKIFQRYGCATCHGASGKGGVKNLNAQGGEVPALEKVAHGFTKEEIKQVIREGRHSLPENPNGPSPTLRMNAWKNILSEEELTSLVEYLFSLAPKDEEW